MFIEKSLIDMSQKLFFDVLVFVVFIIVKYYNIFIFIFIQFIVYYDYCKKFLSCIKYCMFLWLLIFCEQYMSIVLYINEMFNKQYEMIVV